MPANGKIRLPFRKSHAFIIGINNYQYITPLRTAVNDAKGLAERLENQHAYTIHGPLLNPTKAEMLAYLQKTIPEAVGEKDRVVFYFAGHGIALDSEGGPNGYLVPADAKQGDPETLIPMDELHKTLNELPCNHGLLIMDCCFSGAFKWSSGYRDVVRPLPKVIYEERFWRYVQDPAWQVITSSAYDQKALDVISNQSLGMREEGSGNHSPFAWRLFEALAGKGDVIPADSGDGVITATEMYTYLRDVVEAETTKEVIRQTPSIFNLARHDKGEFIFLHPNHRLNLPPRPKRNPFMGLSSYNEDDSHLFFGRDRVIEALEEKMETRSLVVVSGASGTGKSSVIKAGLLPRLRKENYTILPVIRPGKNPMEALTQALPDIDLLQQVSTCVLLVDQYEELITQCLRDEDRLAFEKQLAKWLVEFPNLKIILSVRSDFEPQFESEALAPWWEAGRYIVPAFSLEEIREVITKPAAQSVLFYEPEDLVDRLEEEVSQAPGALPLLSFTLSELYEAYIKSGREDRSLTLDDYYRLGGVVGALRTRANEVYNQLDAVHQSSMRRLMLRMVSLEAGELARKRVFAEDLVYTKEGETERLKNLGQQLVEARLVRSGKDLQGRIYLEPAHDALVRAWSQLWDWIKETGKENLQLHVKLSQAVEDYHSLKETEPNKAKRLLWNANPRLNILKDELESEKHNLNAREEKFIEDSVALRQKRRFILYASLITASIIIGALSYFGIDRSEFANKKRLEAEAQNLVGQAKNVLATQRGLAINLIEQAWEKTSEPLPEVQRFLFRIFSEQFSHQGYNIYNEKTYEKPAKPIPTPCLKLEKDRVAQAWFMPSNSSILSYSESRHIHLWSSDGLKAQKLGTDDLTFNQPKISPDGNHIAAISQNGKLFVWNKQGQEAGITGNIENCTFVSFTRTPHEILIQSNQYELSRWNVKNLESNRIGQAESIIKQASFAEDDTGAFVVQTRYGTQLGHLNLQGLQHMHLGKDVILSPDGKYVWQAVTNRFKTSAYLWRVSDENPQLLLITNSRFTPQFSPDGKYVLVASTKRWRSGYNQLFLYKLYSDKLPQLIREFPFDASNFATFSPDSKYLILLEQKYNKMLYRLDQLNYNLNVDLQDHLHPHTQAVFSPDSKAIIGLGGEQARMLNLNGKVMMEMDLQGNLLDTVIFSPDNKRILSKTTDGNYALWDEARSPFINLDAGKIDYPGDPYVKFQFSQDGESIFFRNRHRKLFHWNLKGEPLSLPEEDLFKAEEKNRWKKDINKTDNKAYSYNADSSLLLIWNHKGGDTLWVADKDTSIQQYLSVAGDTLETVIWSDRGNAVLIDYKNENRRFWNFEGKDRILKLSKEDSCYFSPWHEKMVLVKSNTAELWDYAGMKKLYPVHIQRERIRGVNFSPAGDQLIIYTTNKATRLWSDNGESVLLGFLPADNAVFSPKGNYFLTFDKEKASLHSKQGQLIALFEEHTDSILQAVFSPDETHIITHAKDNVLKCWMPPVDLYNWIKINKHILPALNIEQQVDYLGYTEEQFDTIKSPAEQLKVARYYAREGKFDIARSFYAKLDSNSSLLAEQERIDYFNYKPLPVLPIKNLPQQVIETIRDCDVDSFFNFFLNLNPADTSLSAGAWKSFFTILTNLGDDDYSEGDSSITQLCGSLFERKSLSRDIRQKLDRKSNQLNLLLFSFPSTDIDFFYLQLRALEILYEMDEDSVDMDGQRKLFDADDYVSNWLKQLKLTPPSEVRDTLKKQLANFYILYIESKKLKISDPRNPEIRLKADSIFTKWLKPIEDVEWLVDMVYLLQEIDSQYGKSDGDSLIYFTIEKIKNYQPQSDILPAYLLNFGYINPSLQDYTWFKSPKLLLDAAYYHYLYPYSSHRDKTFARGIFTHLTDQYNFQPGIREQILFLDYTPAQLSPNLDASQVLNAARIYDLEKGDATSAQIMFRKFWAVTPEKGEAKNILSTREKITYLGMDLDDLYKWRNNYETPELQLKEAAQLIHK